MPLSPRSSFIIHHSSFIIPHSSFHIPHASFNASAPVIFHLPGPQKFLRNLRTPFYPGIASWPGRYPLNTFCSLAVSTMSELSFSFNASMRKRSLCDTRERACNCRRMKRSDGLRALFGTASSSSVALPGFSFLCTASPLCSANSGSDCVCRQSTVIPPHTSAQNFEAAAQKATGFLGAPVSISCIQFLSARKKALRMPSSSTLLDDLPFVFLRQK